MVWAYRHGKYNTASFLLVSSLIGGAEFHSQCLKGCFCFCWQLPDPPTKDVRICLMTAFALLITGVNKMPRRLQFKGEAILSAITDITLSVSVLVGFTFTFTHSCLDHFLLNQPPGPTCNLAAPHRRSAVCKLLRWFYCPAAIKGVEPTTRSYRAHTSIHSIFISHFKKHRSHQNYFLTAFLKKSQSGK